VLAEGGIALDLPVDLDRPRDRSDQSFIGLRARLLRCLGVDDTEGSTSHTNHSTTQSTNHSTNTETP
jgi:hypothetical protein